MGYIGPRHAIETGAGEICVALYGAGASRAHGSLLRCRSDAAPKAASRVFLELQIICHSHPYAKLLGRLRMGAAAVIVMAFDGEYESDPLVIQAQTRVLSLLFFVIGVGVCGSDLRK